MMQVTHGDCLAFLPTIPADSVHSCVTSPPYYNLRDYQTGLWVGGDPDCEHRKADPAKSIASSGLHRPESSPVGHRYEGYRSICRRCGAKRVDQQIGLEDSIEEYVEKLVQVFREVRRVLRPDGTLWLVLDDSYSDGGRGDGRPGDKQFSDRGSRLPRFSSELPPKNLLLMPARGAGASGGWLDIA
jgi:DNA modification methylase